MNEKPKSVTRKQSLEYWREMSGQLKTELDWNRREVERLKQVLDEVGPLADGHWAEAKRLQARVPALEAELERLREGHAKDTEQWFKQRDTLQAEVERLRAALNKAGDRLAQVQPGVTEPWAYDIIPKAEQEIADALK